jgi:phosphatidate cytidylyltransferase
MQDKLKNNLYTNYPLLIILGIIVSVVSQIGDLSASAIKRYTEIKDFSNLMPGHGGMLDRFDSILFVAPIVYYTIFIIIRI